MTVRQFSHVTARSKGLGEDGAPLTNWIEEYFYADDELHREDGPAIIKRNDAFGILEEYYYRRGKLDRKSGPAVIKRNADGSTEEEYYRDGELHRKNGPAVIKHNADGSTEEEYYQDGKLHRKKGPALVKRNADGSTEERYADGEDRLHKGFLHRFDGPAYIRRNPDGSIQEEGYYYGGVPRRPEFGPAYIKHNADGSTVREYCRDGMTVKTEYLNSAGVILKTVGLMPGQQCGQTHCEVSVAEDKGLTSQSVALKVATLEQPAVPSINSGPNRYAALKNATPQTGIENTPRATRKSRAPAPA
jgi:hypothetical protein